MCRTASPNGYGIVVTPGSGWHTALPYNANLLKQSKEFSLYMQKLNAAGYTTFVITGTGFGSVRDRIRLFRSKISASSKC